MHFLNTRLWVVRIFKGYFLRQQHPPQQEQRPEEQQTRGPQRRTLPIMTLGKMINSTEFNSPQQLSLVISIFSQESC